MKILIPHSWSLNMGDAAMLMTMIKMLEDIAPGSTVTALVSHPEFTRERCDVAARLVEWPWPIHRKSALDVLAYPFLFAGNLISVMAYRLFKARIFPTRFSRPLSEFFDCDVVISPGGDFISPYYWFITTFSEFLFAKILEKRLVIFSQTIGPFRGFLNRRLSAMVLGLADLIIVREHETARRLGEIGVRSYVTADLAFAFPLHFPRRKPRNRVVICAKKVRERREWYKGRLREITKRIIREFDCEVVYLPTDTHDVEFQAEMAAGIPEVRLVSEVYSPQKIAEMLSGADFLISTRMHAMILGSLSATPFFAIGDSFKFREVLGMLCEDCSIEIDDLDDDGIDMVIQRMRERQRLRKAIEKRLPGIKEESMRNALILAEKFEEWGYSGNNASSI